MVKADLVRRARKAARLKSPAAQQAVEALFERIGAALERGDRVALRRFGVLETGLRKTRGARNPRTGDAISLSPSRVVRFRPATGLRSFPGVC